MIQQKNWVIWVKFAIVDAFLVNFPIFTKTTPSQRLLHVKIGLESAEKAGSYRT